VPASRPRARIHPLLATRRYVPRATF